MKFIIKLILPAIFLITVGCISWDSGWKTKVTASAQGDVKQLSAAAAVLEKSADTSDNIKKIITAYENITAVEPENFEALKKLTEYTFLIAYIYTKDTKERGEYYLKSLKFAERAMYTNPKFRELADQGKPVWENVSVLDSREMAPMFYWYLSIGQYWTDQNLLTRLANFYWPARDKLVLERMTAVEPDWDHGRIYMSWACFYAILPGILGGDLKKSAENFDKALKIGPETFVHFYTRARYLHVKTGDRDAFKKDLEFILSKELKKTDNEFQWDSAYHKKAKELLDEINNLF